MSGYEDEAVHSFHTSRYWLRLDDVLTSIELEVTSLLLEKT